jgi:hypothetical protein
VIVEHLLPSAVLFSATHSIFEIKVLCCG